MDTGQQTIHVALIDDDEEDFLLTREQLSDVLSRRYKLEWFSSYNEGLAAIRSKMHDVYLVDYHLGAHNGLELISQAIAEGNTSPMILLTGQGASDIDEKAMRIGAADYLVKGSFDHDMLDRTLRYAIRHFKALKEVRRLHEESEQLVQERTQELAQTVKDLEQSNEALMKQIIERELAQEALRESQNFVLSMAKNFPSGTISAIDKDWNYIFAEGMGMANMWQDKESLIGSSLRSRVTEEEFKILEGPITRAFKGENNHFDLHHLGRDHMVYAVPLPDSSDEINGVMLVSQDITERKKAETEVLNALRKERELNELKSRFVSMASHEFRTPLATILSSLALIERYNRDGDEEKRQKHIARIKSSVGHMVSTLNDFLSIGKLEEGRIDNKPEKFDLARLCNDIREEMEITAKPGQVIKCTHAGPLAEVELDEQLLRNIMINLISNAIKYSGEDSEIHLEVVSQNDRLEISVKDQGIGIPDEDQQHIFSTFFRAHNATNIQGTGLGLNIVKRYLDLMNGTIAFESEPGKGTTFKIKFEL